MVQIENFSARRNLSAKVKPKRKNDIEQMGLLHKKVRILGDGMKVSVLPFLCIKGMFGMQFNYVWCEVLSIPICSGLTDGGLSMNIPTVFSIPTCGHLILFFCTLTLLLLENQIIKEKKSARESFVCGACGQVCYYSQNSVLSWTLYIY